MSILNHIHQDQSGSSLSEFVIGLPIFLLIFSGILSISQISHEGIKAMATTNHELWVASQKNTAISVTPVGAGAGIAADIFTGDFKSESLLGTGAQAGGIYFDAWAKNEVASLIPGAPGKNVKPVRTIDKIHENFTNKSPAQNLLDDNLLDPDIDAKLPKGGVGVILASVANKLLNVSGGKLGLATGIRYGERRATKKGREFVTAFGAYSTPKLSLSLPINTEPTHRVVPVTMVRLQHAQDPQLDSILELKNKPDMSGAPKWGTKTIKRSKKDEITREKEAQKKCLQTVVEKHRENWKNRCEQRKGKSCRNSDFPRTGSPSDTGNLYGAKIDSIKKCEKARNKIRKWTKRN